MIGKEENQTIKDFGDQWKLFQNNTGFYASIDLFEDFCGPLLDISDVKGKRVLDVGSGTGRIVNMLLDSGAKSVVAVEPSDAFQLLKKNTEERSDKVKYFNLPGESIPKEIEVDYAFSVGVLHHIPNPLPTVKRVYEILKPNGKFIIWLYGREGNEIYLKIIKPIKRITSTIPDFLLIGLAFFLNILATFYISAGKFVNLPLQDYINKIFSKLSWKNRQMIIFDQLNPAYAKYYSQEEAERLLQHAGFINVRFHHRHGYSWTVIGIKPKNCSE
ncbi:MAG TPA: methyltransferase domain-containing protein [Anaerolineae bacterium]|nr:methyltransferase domain-containing protein [Anaerolineae bacterium]